MRFFDKSWLLKAICLSIILSGCVVVLPPPGPDRSKVEARGQVDAFGKTVNDFRAQNKLRPVSRNSVLIKAATQQSTDMNEMGKLVHLSRNGEDLSARLKKHGYPVCYARENIAHKYKDETAAFNAWLTSPEHRKNMLNPNVTEYGMARVGNYYTLILGSRC